MPAELPAVVPGPVPPDDSDAWYAPDIRAQYHVTSGVVATVAESDDTYRYRTREPILSTREAETRDRIVRRFRETPLSRPKTREGAIERMTDGLPDTWDRHLSWLTDHSPAGRRRLEYHLGASLRALGDLTPLALDDRIRIGDTSGDRLTVHTRDFAPAVTDLDADSPHLQRFLSERVDTETVAFQGFEIPVTVYRRKVLGADRSHTRYDVREPERLPGDRDRIAAVRAQLLASPPDSDHDDRAGAVLDRARRLLRRRLVYRDVANGSGFRDGTLAFSLFHRVARVLAGWLDLEGPGPRIEPGADRIEDLTYYVARDLLGDGPLTIPLRDSRLRSIEVTDGGEQVTVLPHRGAELADVRMPATCSIADADEFRRLARSLAAAGGVELSADRPTAAVDLERSADGRTRSHRCSVSLPAADGTAHISITSERETPPTPIDLVSRGVLDAETVAAIWTIAENRGVVVFVGPARAEPAVALAAHVPFIPPSVRPVSVAHRNRPVPLPQETGITLQRPPDPPTGPSRLDDGVAIDSDLLVLPDIETPPAMRRFGDVIATGRGIFAAARTTDREFFADVADEAGLSAQALGAIDLLVELPDPERGSGATAWTPETTPRTELAQSESTPRKEPAQSESTPRKEPAQAESTPRKEPAQSESIPREEPAPPESSRVRSHPEDVTWTCIGAEGRRERGERPGGATEPDRDTGERVEDFAKALSERLSVQTTQAGLAADLERRRRYVEYLQTAGLGDRSSFLGFLSDLRTDEAATVERIQRTLQG